MFRIRLKSRNEAKNEGSLAKSRKLRNVAMIIACLTVFNANSLLAQTVTYTDPSGVTAIYEYSANGGAHAVMTGITDVPATVIKWVIPEQITFSSGTFPLKGIGVSGSGCLGLPENNTLKEIVFPRQLTIIGEFPSDANGGVNNPIMGGKFF